MFSDLQYERQIQKENIIKTEEQTQLKIYQFIMHNQQLIQLDLSKMNMKMFPFFPQTIHVQFLILDNNLFQELPPLPPNLVYLSMIKNYIKESKARKYALSACYSSILAMNYNCYTDEEKYPSVIVTSPNSPYKAQSKESQIIYPLTLLNLNPVKLTQYLRYKYNQCSAILAIQKLIRGALVRLRKRKKIINDIKLFAKVRKIGKKWYQFTKDQIYIRNQLSNCYATAFKKLLTAVRAKKLKMQQSKKKLQLIEILSKFIHRKNVLYEHSLDYFSQGNLKVYINMNQLREYEQLLRKQKSPNLQQLANGLSEYRKQQTIQSTKNFKIQKANYFSFRFNIESPTTFKGKISVLQLFQYQQYLVKITKNNSLPIIEKFLTTYEQEIKIQRKYHLNTLNQQQKQSYLYHLERVNEFQKMEYLSVVQIQLENRQLLMDLYKCIYKYNNEILFQRLNEHYDGTLLSLLFQPQLDFISCVILIQKQFRSFKARKSSYNINKIIEKIKQIRSALLIQRWIRSIRLLHQIKLVVILNYYLKNIQSNILYIQFDIYYQLTHIIQQAQNQPFKFSKLLIQIAINHQLQQLDCQYQIQTNSNKKYPIFNMKFQELFHSNHEYKINFIKADVYHLIHFNCQIKNSEFNNGLQIIFPSLEEARKRLAILTLMTYRFKKQMFVKLFSQKQIQQESKLLNYLNQCKQVYQVQQNQYYQLNNHLNSDFNNELFVSSLHMSQQSCIYQSQFFLSNGQKNQIQLNIYHKGKSQPMQNYWRNSINYQRNSQFQKKTLNKIDLQFSNELSTITNSNNNQYDSQRWSMMSAGWKEIQSPRKLLDNSMQIEYANEKIKYKYNQIELRRNQLKTRVKTDSQRVRVKQQSTDTELVVNTSHIKTEKDFEVKVVVGLNLINDLYKRKERKKIQVQEYETQIKKSIELPKVKAAVNVKCMSISGKFDFLI